MKFCTPFLLNSVYKRVFRIFLFCLDLELLINLVSVSVQKPGFFLFWQMTQDLNQIKTNLEHTFEHIDKYETCARFQQNWSYSKVVGGRQSFQFFRQNTWLLGNNRVLSKYLYEILHYLICITKLSKTSVHISRFYIIHWSHLNVWLISDQGLLVPELRIFSSSYVELWSEHKLLCPIFLISAAENFQFNFTSD